MMTIQTLIENIFNFLFWNGFFKNNLSPTWEFLSSMAKLGSLSFSLSLSQRFLFETYRPTELQE